MDPYQHLHITRNSDGSITRSYPVPFTFHTDDDEKNPSDPPPAVLFKDVPLNPSLNTSIRIFIPNKHHHQQEKEDKRLLPVILYFHAGGFILCTPAIAPVHDLTAKISTALPAVVLSVDYRLAPEHRLPAAYKDALDALLWLRDLASSDPWLSGRADLSRCFIMGSSSGGNIAFHLALRSLRLDLYPLKIRGFIMDQPFFGGEERTESELRLADDQVVPLPVTDLMWEMALPVGANRDHEFSNPWDVGEIKGLMTMPRCLVRGYVGDPLIDRMRRVAEMLDEGGASVVAMLDEKGFHGEELYNSDKAEEMIVSLREFVYDDI